MKNKKIIFSSGIANTFEWYDYALFGHFASIIGYKFFPSENHDAYLLNAFAVFAVGYLMRPLGGVFFGIIGDKFGRRVALSTAVICMALPTACIGIIPSYDSIGISATIIMVIMRMLQGLSMGGALTGSISFLIEHSEQNKRGLIGSIPMASICLGILLGTIVAYTVRESLSYEDFEEWGWRIPFLLGIFIIGAGFYIKYYTTETPMFEKVKSSGTIPKSPLKTVFKHYWFDMLVSIMINSTGSVIFYFQAIFVVNYLKENRGFDPADVDILNGICYLGMAFICLISGKISDIVGKRSIYFVVLIVLILPAFFQIPHIIQYGDWFEIIIAQSILAVLAAGYIGSEPALQAEFYPTNVRSTALSVSYNLATSIFGGTAPFIVEYILYKTGSLNTCGIYVAIVSFLSLIGLYFYKDRSSSDDKRLNKMIKSNIQNVEELTQKR